MSSPHSGPFEDMFLRWLAIHQLTMLSMTNFGELYLTLARIWLDTLPSVEGRSRKMSDVALLKVLKDIILTSHHKGERDNAAMHYERVAGKPFAH